MNPVPRLYTRTLWIACAVHFTGGMNGLTVSRTPPRFHGTVVSLYTAALDGGGVLGTPLCGAIAHLAGYRAMFAAMAAASLAGLLLMTRDWRALTRLGELDPMR